MTSNHEEYSNDLTLENLNVQYKFTEVVRIFAEKVTKELEVINLAFTEVAVQRCS